MSLGYGEQPNVIRQISSKLISVYRVVYVTKVLGKPRISAPQLRPKEH